MTFRDMSSSSSVTLGRDSITDSLVSLSPQARGDGLYLIGKTHQGKSALIEQMITQDMAAGRGLCLLDPHGDLTERVLARLPSSRHGDVTLLDLHDSERPFGLNLFACPDPQNPASVARTVSRVMEIFAKVWDVGPDTPRLGRVLRNVTATLAETGLTMAEIPDLLEDRDYRAGIVKQVGNPQVQRFWRFFETIPKRDFPFWIESTLNRVDPYVTDPLRTIVGQQSNTVHWREAMDGRQIILVKLDPELPEPTSILGATIVGQILDAAFSRTTLPPEKRVPFMLYADEYQRFATPAFATLLEQARKFGMATTLAHQRRSQLDHAHRATPLGAVNLVVFAVSGADAEELAKEFDATPGPVEKILKMITKPVYKTTSEVIWDPPEAEAQLSNLHTAVKESKERLDVFQKLLGDGKGTDLQLSWRFNPSTLWLNNLRESQKKELVPIHRRPEDRDKLPTDGYPDYWPSYFGIGWAEWIFWRIPSDWMIPILADLEMAMRWDKIGMSSTCWIELEPIATRFRDTHREFWCAPRHRNGWVGTQQFTTLSTIPCPEGAAWIRTMAAQLKRDVEIAEKAVTEQGPILQRCREVVVHKSYLHEEPVKTTSYHPNRPLVPVESIQQYRWEAGPPRTYADMEGEIANQLAGLQPHTAKVRIIQNGKRQEYLIETIKPETPQAPAFRPRSVGTPRDQVDAEIAARSTTPSKRDEEVFAEEPPKKRKPRRPPPFQ